VPALAIPAIDRGPKLLEEMTTAEVKDALTRTDVAIIAAGAIEQHGAHLPLGTDWYIGLETTRRVLRVLAERGHQAVGYCIPLGKSDGFLNFPGSLTLSNEVFIAVQKEVAACLHHQGFRKFVLLSSNGGNATTMLMAGDEIHRSLDCPVIYVDPLPFQQSYRDEILKNPAIDHHGAEGETSKVLAAYPELVQIDRAGFVEPLGPTRPPNYGPGVRIYRGKWEDFAPGGVVGDPRLGDAATGNTQYERNAAWCADIIEKEFFGDLH
jgi:creatinine amidohydrolase